MAGWRFSQEHCLCFSPGLKFSTLSAADLCKLASVWHFMCFLQEKDLLSEESCPKICGSVVQKCSNYLCGVFFICHSASWDSRSKLQVSEIEVGELSCFVLSPVFAFLVLLGALCSLSFHCELKLGQLKSSREVPRRDAPDGFVQPVFGQVSAQSSLHWGLVDIQEQMTTPGIRNCLVSSHPDETKARAEPEKWTCHLLI